MSKLFAAFMGALMGCIHGAIAWGCNLTFSSVPVWSHAIVVEKTVFVLSIIDTSMLLIVLTSGWWVERALDLMEYIHDEYIVESEEDDGRDKLEDE